MCHRQLRYWIVCLETWESFIFSSLSKYNTVIFLKLFKMMASRIPEEGMCLTCWRLHSERLIFMPKEDWPGGIETGDSGENRVKIPMARFLSLSLPFFSDFFPPFLTALLISEKMMTVIVKHVLFKKIIVHILSASLFWEFYQSQS